MEVSNFMNTQRAYINGFVKRANEYGYNQEEALYMLKQASPETLAMSPGSLTAAQAGQGAVHPVAPAPPTGVSAINPAMAAKLRLPTSPGDAAYYGAPAQQKPSVVPPQHMNEAMMQSGQRSFKNMIDAYKAGKQPELGKQSSEQAPYGGVKTLGEMWNEFKTKTPTLATKLPVSKGIPSIDTKLAVK